MNNTFIFLFVLVIYSSCFILGNCENLGRSSSSSNSVSASKKLRVLNPSAARLFHLLRLGMSGSGSGGIDDEDLQSDDDNFVQKRQYDDYGHMRFGKRNPPGKEFDDYGHLRFGK